MKSLSGKASEKKIKLVNHGKRDFPLTDKHDLTDPSHSVDTKVTPIWNTMAAIPGHSRDEVVIIGCHRDGGSSSTNLKVLCAKECIQPGSWVPPTPPAVRSLCTR